MNPSAEARSEELRYQALLALPLTEATGLGHLLSALRDDSWRVRKVAVERLTGEVPASLAVPRLIEALSDQDNASLRNSALEALVRYGERAVPALCEALEFKADDVRKFSLDALGEIRSHTALSTLRSALTDPDPNVRTAAVEALGKLGGRVAFGDLLRIAAGNQLDLQLAALDALGRCEGDVPFEAIEAHLNDRYLRRVAVRALGRSNGEQAERAILTAALDPTRGTREAAFAALALRRRAAHSRWETTIASLGALERAALSTTAMEMLGAEDLPAAEGSAFLLGWLGIQEAAIPLARAAEREELHAALQQALVLLGPAIVTSLSRDFAGFPAAAQSLALDALTAMAEAPSVPEEFRREAQALALNWLGRDEDEVRLSAIRVLGAVGDMSSARALLGLLPDAAVAEAAVDSLRGIGDRSPEGIRDLCRSELPGVASSSPDIFRLLGQVGTAEDLPTLRAALRGGDPASRRAAADGLAALRLPECTSLLRTALTDEDAGVRRYAARGLAGVRSPEALASLEAAVNDPDESVATAAADGLGDRGVGGVAETLVEVVNRESPKRPVVALAALNALERIGMVDQALLDRSANSGDSELAKVAIRIAAKQGNWSVVHGLVRHPRWDVRSETAAALGKEGGAAAEALLRGMLEQEADLIAGKAVAGALAAILASRPA
jgi:HEAT repeat protein